MEGCAVLGTELSSGAWCTRLWGWSGVGGAEGQGVGQEGSGCVAIVNVGCGRKLTGLSVCNLDGRDTKRPLVTLLGYYGGEGRGGEGD